MFDLLRRSCSTGIGVLLQKMKNVIGNYPDVGPRLASQRTGSFFVLTGTTKRELKADRSLMETVQSSEAEVAELARATRPAVPRK